MSADFVTDKFRGYNHEECVYIEEASSPGEGPDYNVAAFDESDFRGVADIVGQWLRSRESEATYAYVLLDMLQREVERLRVECPAGLAHGVMGEVSEFETDWWGRNGD